MAKAATPPASSEQYANPPLIEAACDFRFVPSQPWDATITGLLYSVLRRRFPERQTVPGMQAMVTPDMVRLRGEFGGEPRTQFARKDGTAVVGVARDQITISRLRPYAGWQEFRPTIEHVLAQYVKVARPAGIARVGLRYINRVRVPFGPEPGETVDIAQNFNVFPYIDPEIPGKRGDFAVLVHLGYRDGRDALRIQIDSFGGEDEEGYGFDLDLDYFVTPQESIGIPEAPAWLEEAHTAVKTAFEGSIQDPLRELFRKGGE